ncbi:hypothetical protein ES705_49245 [subsurface metagenome]
MKLEKAIEIHTRYEKDYLVRTEPDFDDAVKLGNEALKRLIAWRNDNDEDLLWDLPGETEN